MVASRWALPKTIQPRCHPPDEDLPRLGVIALATDLTFERDAARLIGWNEAVVHVARIQFDNPTTPENLSAMGPKIASAAALIVPGAKLAAIAFACTAASVTISNRVVAEAIGNVHPGVPVVTPSGAAVAALKALGADRAALLTPYLPETTAPMVDYFERNGINIERSACFGLADDRDMARLEKDTLIEAAVSLDSDSVDAVFLSCTAMPSLDVIDAIEARIRKPVVGSNQATLWALRGLAGLSQQTSRTEGVGRLFGLPAPSGDLFK
ncbi:aspartate/glutamate racemase family protein [Algicella marina]|uniref:Ectoine utilization protein EutA n=1 Tax=Algicella marina TaxID=2683284 RepID=A0A6P1SXC0_9RHOB|nr:aspartate/glutamate racemase family protein [Algicella marina]QHQ34407.1 ectoine utilization protein EutA [Algicella marina]